MTVKRERLSREKIVRVATELIDERGYHGMNLEDVAKRLDVTRPALYYYYSRKEQLLLDIHNNAQSHLVEAAFEISEKKLGPLETLYLLIHSHAKIATNHSQIVAVMFEEEHNLDVNEREKIREVRTGYNQRVIDVFQQAQQFGYLVDDFDPKLAVFLMLGACNWIARWYKPGKWMPEDVAKSAARIVLRGLLTEEGVLVLSETRVAEL